MFESQKIIREIRAIRGLKMPFNIVVNHDEHLLCIP